jgi:hypothetical protein
MSGTYNRPFHMDEVARLSAKYAGRLDKLPTGDPEL